MRSGQRLYLHLLLLGQIAGGHQVVFHFLQRRNHGLLVGGASQIQRCAGRFNRCAACAAIKQTHRQRGAQRPEEIGGVEQIRQHRVAIAAAGRQRKRREVCRARHTNLRVGGCHAALCRCDVWALLQQGRSQHFGHYRRPGQMARHRQAEYRRCLAQQGRQRMLVLGTRGLRLNQAGLRAFVLRLGLCHIGR